MNEKIYVQRKYNKCINILLAIYVVLCLVLSLLLNGFFVNPKAIDIDNSFNVDVSLTYNGNTGTGGRSFTQNNNNARICIIIDSDLITAFEDSNNIFTGGTVIAFRDVNINNIPVSPNVGYGIYSAYDYETSTVPTYVNNFDSSYSEYMRFIWFPGQYPESTTPNSKIIQQVVDNKSSIGYVDNLEDLKKYMKDGDDSVVNYSDPDNPPTTTDGNLPTPQKVNLWDSAQNCAGLTWDNPKSINKYIKDLGDNVGIEIEWKPSIALTLGMLTVDSLTSSEWLPVYKGVISKSGSLINAFVSKKNDNARLDNNLNGFNYEIDDKFIFTPTINDNDYLEQIAKNNHVRLWYANEDNVRGGSLSESDVKNFKKNTINDSNDLKSTKNVVGGEAETPVGEEGVNVAPSGVSKLDLIQGIITGVGKVGKWIFDSFQIDTSNYRVRYYVKDGNNYTVSNWVDAKRGYDTNENAKEPTNVNFTDSNNNPVSNPSYLPSNQVTSSDSNSNSWWDRFYTENNNVLANLQTAFANFTADSGDFFGFFRALFTEFPEFYIFLCMGLGLAIMLRILGR